MDHVPFAMLTSVSCCSQGRKVRIGSLPIAEIMVGMNPTGRWSVATHLIVGAKPSRPHCQVLLEVPDQPWRGLGALSGLRPAVLTPQAAHPAPFKKAVGRPSAPCPARLGASANWVTRRACPDGQTVGASPQTIDLLERNSALSSPRACWFRPFSC